MADLPLSDPGPLPELAWLPVDKCSVDPSYQRSLEHPPSPKHIEKIATNFRWARFQAVLAVKAGDGWRIVDGQHRVEAARRRSIKHIPAVVLDDLAVADQADAFVWANRDRVPVSANAIFYAELAAGNPETLTLDRITRAAGVEIVRYRVSAIQCPAGYVAPIGALKLILRKYGEDKAAAAIRAVVMAYGAFKGALTGNLFLAAAQYLDGKGSLADLARAFAGFTWQKLEAIGAETPGGQFSRINAIVACLRRPNVLIGATPSKPPAVVVAPLPEPTLRVPATTVAPRAAAGGGRSIFEDDPRARRDPGSSEKLGRPEHFGASLTGGSLR